MRLFNVIVDLLLAPFRHLPPVWGLVAWGMLSGVVVLLLFKATSNPDKVARARNRALARVLELWLYRDEPLTGLGAVARMLGDNLRYLASLLLPMLASMLPMLLLLAQAHDWFAVRAPQRGESVLVVARVRADAGPGVFETAALAVDGVPLTGLPVVRSPVWREIAWRLPLERLETINLAVQADGQTVTKAAALGPALTRRSTVRSASRFGWVLQPGEPRLPAAQPFTRLELRLPAATYDLLGWRTNWLWGVLAVSLVTGLLLKKPLRVEF